MATVDMAERAEQSLVASQRLWNSAAFVAGESMPTVPKMVHYRRFEPLGAGWSLGTLQNALAIAFARSTSNGSTYGMSWKARTFPVPSEPELKRFAHNLAVTKSSISGSLCLYCPDDWASVLRREAPEANHSTLDETLRQVEIAERPPLDGEDYLRGIAYWMVIGNHLFVVQHSSIQTKAFEEYFGALLRVAAALSEEDRFALRAVFNKAGVGGDLENITAVEVGGILSRGLPEILSVQETVTEEQRTLGRTTSRFERARGVLEAVFGAPDAERILSEIPKEAELEVDVRFGYKTQRRGVSRAALADIARSARNLPDGEVIAFGRDGKQVGDDLRLSMPMPFTLLRDRGALLDLDDVRTKLARVYQRFVEDGKIEL